MSNWNNNKNDDYKIELFNSWTYSKKNYVTFGLGLVSVILGYITMGTGQVNSFQSLTLAPILLFIGYIILIPFSIIYDFNDSQKN